jgi:uncharacterized protein YjbI with pentapeptide repeats
MKSLSGLLLFLFASVCWSNVDYVFSSVGSSTSQVGGFPAGTTFSGSITLNGIPVSLPANTNLASYLVSFSFSDGAGNTYTNSVQTNITFTGQTDGSGNISQYVLTGSVNGGPPNFSIAPGSSGVTSVPSSTVSAKWTGPTSLSITTPTPTPTPTTTTPAFVNGCRLKPRAVCPNTDFTGVDLTGVNLSSSFLINANFSSATLTNANLSGAQLSDCVFDNAVMTGANLQGADLGGCSLQSVSLSTANLSKANLTKSNFSSASMNGSNLTRATAVRANFSSADLTNANLTKALMVDVSLTSANLTSANLFQINAAGADLTSATLNMTNLKNAYLARAVLSGATVTNVLFNGKTILTGAKLDTNGPITAQ